MQLNDLQPQHGKKPKKRIGRGGKRGTYSGRGIKGQKAHSSGRLRPELRDIIKKIHKKRGYGKNRSRTVSDRLSRESAAVNLAALESAFSAGDTVSPQTLAAAGLISKRAARTTPVKILARGTLSKRLSVKNCRLSKAAREAIVAAGGNVA